MAVRLQVNLASRMRRTNEILLADDRQYPIGKDFRPSA